VADFARSDDWFLMWCRLRLRASFRSEWMNRNFPVVVVRSCQQIGSNPWSRAMTSTVSSDADHHQGIPGGNWRHQVRNVNTVEDESLTLGQRTADGVARAIGSWRFIIIQSMVLFAWIVLNAIGWMRHWDPYPFILLNLALSFQAAYSAPIIMMSQNRLATKDRLTAEHDYQVNVRAEIEVAQIRTRLSELAGRQWDALVELQQQQLTLLQHIEELTAEIHRLTADVGLRRGGDDVDRTDPNQPTRNRHSTGEAASG
jgi:uncharacterized membrane protein